MHACPRATCIPWHNWGTRDAPPCTQQPGGATPSGSDQTSGASAFQAHGQDKFAKLARVYGPARRTVGSSPAGFGIAAATASRALPTYLATNWTMETASSTPGLDEITPCAHCSASCAGWRSADSAMDGCSSTAALAQGRTRHAARPCAPGRKGVDEHARKRQGSVPLHCLGAGPPTGRLACSIALTGWLYIQWCPASGRDLRCDGG